MAVSYANTEFLFRGSVNLVYTEVTMDSSYASGGENLDASALGLAVIKSVFAASSPAGYDVEVARSTDILWLIKVYAFSNTTNTVLGGIVTGKDLSALTIPMIVVGR